MHSDTMCDDCFDLMMEQEVKDFEVYYSQKQNCFLCKKKLSSWIIKYIDKIPRAVCWNDCDNTTNKHYRLIIKDGKLSAG